MTRTMTMNMAVLKKSRRRPTKGDFFVLQPTSNVFLFGRVIRTDAVGGGFPNCNMIYISGRQFVDLPDVPDVRPDELLVAPLMTNNLPWSRGYFGFAGHRDLRSEECLPRHCFSDGRGHLYDENGVEVAIKSEPVGVYGLASYSIIDDVVSKALGLPLSE